MAAAVGPLLWHASWNAPLSPLCPSLLWPASAAPLGAEGGALYALGLIHTNHGHDVRQFLLDSLRATQHEVRALLKLGQQMKGLLMGCGCCDGAAKDVWWLVRNSLSATQHEMGVCPLF